MKEELVNIQSSLVLSCRIISKPPRGRGVSRTLMSWWVMVCEQAHTWPAELRRQLDSPAQQQQQEAVAYLGFHKGGGSNPPLSPLPHLPPPPSLHLPLSPLPTSHPRPLLPLEVGPLNLARGSGRAL